MLDGEGKATKGRHVPHLVPPLGPSLWTSQVQALRSIEPYLNLEKLYVLGTNCVDNGPREGLDKFLKAASKRPGEKRRDSVVDSRGGEGSAIVVGRKGVQGGW